MIDAFFTNEFLRIVVVLGLLTLASVALFLFSRQTESPLQEERTLDEEDLLERLSHAQIRSMLYYYRARVVSVYDGDTIRVDMDLGLGIAKTDQSVRLWKINTPEVRGEERPQGLKVRDYVRSLILDQEILLRTILDKRGVDQTGKFGRLLGEVLIEQKDGGILNLNELLLQKGMAQPMGEDGSTIAVTGQRSLGAANIPDRIPCRYCGEMRRLDSESWQVSICPNCFDPAYSLREEIARQQQYVAG